MGLTRFSWLFYAVLLLALLGRIAPAQKPPSAETESDQFKKLAEVFQWPDSRDIRGKAWMTVDRGPANHRSDLLGWVIHDSPEEITILDWYGALHRLRKPAADEKRPELDDEEANKALWQVLQDAYRSIAWKVTAEDYAAKSHQFLAKGLPEDKEDDNRLGFVNQRFALADHIEDAARYAHIAYQLKQKEHADNLYELALKAQKKYAKTYPGGWDKSGPLHVCVANRIASASCNGAIYAGHHGTSRKELLERWEGIAAIPYHQYRDEAKAMIKHYQSLLDEDARWVEPDAQAIAKLTTEQQVAYWLYHLRDLRVGQRSSPGHCSVVGGFVENLDDEKDTRPQAADELKKIGMAAVPQLIAHLEDERPTRCKAHWRSYWPEGHYLLRYGDCCQQIFEAITGANLFEGTTTVSYPVRDRAAKQCKESAEKWWQEYKAKRGEP